MVSAAASSKIAEHCTGGEDDGGPQPERGLDMILVSSLVGHPQENAGDHQSYQWNVGDLVVSLRLHFAVSKKNPVH